MHMDFCDLMQFSKAKKKAFSISQLGMACSLQACPLLHLPPDSFFNALLKMNTEFTDNFFEHFNLEKQRTEAHYCIVGCMAEWPELHEHCRQNTPDLRQSAVSRGSFSDGIMSTSVILKLPLHNLPAQVPTQCRLVTVVQLLWWLPPSVHRDVSWQPGHVNVRKISKCHFSEIFILFTFVSSVISSQEICMIFSN